jgi:hypothetical protein
MKRIDPLNVLFYAAIFGVTQIAGLLLSLVICFVLQDFTWAFVRVALVNSLILGCALVGGCYFSQRLVLKMKPAYIAAISSTLILGVGTISLLILLALEPTLFIYYNRGALSFVFVNFLFIIALHIIGSGLIMYREIVVDKEKTIGNERLLKNQMELRLLSSKINPHFLFNTLNMIISLLKEPAKAESAILNLSDLLRENLEQSDKVSIPVAQEIGNVRKYLEIQQLRFGERLRWTVEGDLNFSVPPLIVQPLVENSIKHNMQSVPQLSITIRLLQDTGRNRIVITDSQKALLPSMLDRGQGLTITRKRVENSGGTFSVRDGGIEMSFDP